MENNTTFVDGLIFKKKKDGAPEFVKGSISMKVDELKAFLDKHNNNGWVNADLLVSKDGQKLYFKLNDWKPAQEGVAGVVGEQPAPAIDAIQYPKEDVNPEDIPF